ncbi:BgTH12-01723 [Blumeria graminis f. sp. triticale]|uniref:BgTH12-01723 n=1 Tax=Blumeria graminis f. sp. triticale TaxID=1689686 RepID=A0A9W4GE69_BLUGR|nr:BgTH12-01723 [Blumeria graminis f. sp. triticale]
MSSPNVKLSYPRT